MSGSPILLIGCDEIGSWPQALGLSPGAPVRTLVTPGAVIPPATPGSPFHREVERLVRADGVRDFVICGHTDCGVLAPVFLGDAPDEALVPGPSPAEVGPTRADLRARYPGREGQRLLDVGVQESLLAQAGHLMALPALREAAGAGEVRLELWVREAATGIVHVFDPASGQFEPGKRPPAGCEPPGVADEQPSPLTMILYREP
jgi:carbonic anhydrase